MTDHTPPAHTFTLRLWLEPTGRLSAEWRGRAHHVASGATCTFRDWEALLAFLTVTLAAEAAPPPTDQHPA